jgi:hypothetical protein
LRQLTKLQQPGFAVPAKLRVLCLYCSLSSTFGSFLALNGQLVTIEHRNNPNVDDREKDRNGVAQAGDVDARVPEIVRPGRHFDIRANAGLGIAGADLLEGGALGVAPLATAASIVGGGRQGNEKRGE